MISREDAFRRYVEQYELDVPEELVEKEIQYIRLSMRHRMQYDTLSGGGPHLFPEQELADWEEIQKTAYFEVKSGLVLKAVIEEQGFTAARAELEAEAEAEAMALRQKTTVDMIKTFFGEELSMLERDVKEQKAREWIWKKTGGNIQ